MNPYLVLGVPLDASDQQIRSAYLAAIKLATPESDPERFKLLAAAHEQIKDERSRKRYELLTRECPGDSPLDVLRRYLPFAPVPTPLGLESLKEFLRLCSKK
jgi:curved DNA-binding protein CbpA